MHDDCTRLGVREVKSMHVHKLFASTLALLCLSCEEGTAHGNGKLRILLTAEESITEGLEVGSDGENSQDYAVRFDKYLTVVGGVTIGRSRSGARQSFTQSALVDLKQVPSEGIELGELSDVSAGTWDKVSFRTPVATADMVRLGSLSEEDANIMIAGAYTYWIQGEVLRPQSAGGPVSFDIRASVDTQFSDCSYEGEPGLAVVENGTSTATFTLHGDHIFFNAFPAAGEETIKRLAGYLAEADANGDHKVDSAELVQADASDLFTQARGYSLAGAPIPVVSAFDFVRAQLASQGHFRGEGECIFSLTP
jgi:hypothetical protein